MKHDTAIHRHIKHTLPNVTPIANEEKSKTHDNSVNKPARWRIDTENQFPLLLSGNRMTLKWMKLDRTHTHTHTNYKSLPFLHYLHKKNEEKHILATTKNSWIAPDFLKRFGQTFSEINYFVANCVLFSFKKANYIIFSPISVFQFTKLPFKRNKIYSLNVHAPNEKPSKILLLNRSTDGFLWRI